MKYFKIILMIILLLSILGILYCIISAIWSLNPNELENKIILTSMLFLITSGYTLIELPID